MSYLWLTNDKGEVCVSFAFGKAKMAPLKCTTISRMELAAAVLAVHLDHMLRTELQFLLADSIFWSDSMSALQYIANTNKSGKSHVSYPLSVKSGIMEAHIFEGGHSFAWLISQSFFPVPNMDQWARVPS